MGVDTVIKYPDKLPCFKLDDKTAQPVDGGVNTELPNGALYRRFGFMSTPIYHEVSWNLTEEQAKLLDSWYRYTLHHGTEWFEVRLHQPRGDKKVLMQFAEVFQGCHKVAPDLYQASARLVQWDNKVSGEVLDVDDTIAMTILQPAIRIGKTGRQVEDGIYFSILQPAVVLGSLGRQVKDAITMAMSKPVVRIGGAAGVGKEAIRITVTTPSIRIGT